MTTTPKKETPPQEAKEPGQEKDLLAYANEAERALMGLEHLHIAALCLTRFRENYSDIEDGDIVNALETLIEYSRSCVEDIREGYNEVYKYAAHEYFERRNAAYYAKQREATERATEEKAKEET